MPLPHRWIRRLLLAPGVVLLVFLLVTTVPVWALLALAVSPFVPGRLRPLRVLWIGFCYLVWDAAALLCLFGLWVASGFGWRVGSPAFQRAHYVLAGWFLRMLFWQARWTLRLTIDVVGTDPDTALPGRPELVVCRHAGPGDSFILIHALVNWFQREPRIVLKDTLQWDPAIDVLLNRLPTRFIAPGREGQGSFTEQIGHLAADLDDNDAFVIFPEGGNFTPLRRLRAIARLRDRGHEQMAVKAEAMQHVLAPQPGGLLAALDAAPDAGVIFVAHTGLDRMLTVADVWRELPMDKRLVMRFWSVPPEEIPTGRQERIDWLYDWWRRIDGWVAANRDDAA
ncbi:1-acyl-sn-glycerol-3-phosphate acyltransferase [Micromonospora craniellae]|uniref:1-acyl-sn-glycerol-3-phosphate acyltransferase n=1 Tax=Micromonospora craniellae TaxID=2294034 RepID=A0A372G5B3_9ACTN|nr:1-acyl-sn-glycerol-3-phosphate acyltransferase [Micromonospora craniellae]QOC90520.1 1-acyl-sn-glycerol-3-phosphate acyltransferase [Micromonospora craniellae]RFS48094.1 1-acyl-sn-glycerol-3-phosphate acyltransferase [Micromonospora craniellae]